jgi:hypothetical protein
LERINPITPQKYLLSRRKIEGTLKEKRHQYSVNYHSQPNRKTRRTPWAWCVLILAKTFCKTKNPRRNQSVTTMQNVSECNINNTMMFLNKSCPGSIPQMIWDSQTYITTSTVLLSVLIPVIIIGNVLVILAFGTTRRLRTNTNYFVVSLAFADIMVGGLSLPIFTIAINRGRRWQNLEVKQLWTAIDMITSIASIVNLMYISVDRYVCIQYPLRYCFRLIV